MLDPSTDIRNYPPVDISICGYISAGICFDPFDFSLGWPAYAVLQFQFSYGFPVQFPNSLSGAPDCAGIFDGEAQFRFVPCDSDGDHVMVLAARFARFANPGRGFDDQFDGFEAFAANFVIKIAQADESIAVLIVQVFRSGHAWPQGESCLHPVTTRGQAIGGQEFGRFLDGAGDPLLTLLSNPGSRWKSCVLAYK